MKITKAVREALRRELTAKEYTPQDITVVMTARYGARPRLALRWAHGMTLQDVADEWNQQDASGRAPMTAARVSDYERWPDGGKRPTAYVLLMLGKIYGTTVQRLLDDRYYAALNDKQLFEVVELCRSRAVELEEQAEAKRLASAVAPQPAMIGHADSGLASTALANPIALDETRASNTCETKETPTKRRQVLQIGGSAITGHILDLLDIEPDRLHATLDASTVNEGRLTYFEHVADRLGMQVVKVAPTTILECAVLHFRNVRRLVRDHQKTVFQVRLGRIGTKLGTVVGEILFNEGLFDLAREWYQAAQHAALDVGDRYLADIALAGQAYLPTYSGDPSGVLALVDPRLEQRSRPTPALAWLWSFKGKAHAVRGERAAFEQAMSQARKALNNAPAELIGPGIFSFLPEKLEFYEATGYVKLRDVDRATKAADRALSLYDLTDTTEPALIQLDKACALAQAGEIVEACRVSTRAVINPSTHPAVSVMVRAQEFDALLGDDRAPALRDWRDALAAIRWPIGPSVFQK